jgi:hypothetical protein
MIRLRLFRVTLLPFLLLLASSLGHAQMPYNPFSISIAQVYPIAYEGDPLMFNITVTNTDATKMWPLLIPGTQNAFEKIFYFFVYDAADSSHIRWFESREVSLLHTVAVGPMVKYLAPGQSHVFSANLNDYPRFHHAIESHHSIDGQLFAGKYRLELVYDPSGNPLGDSIYDYVDVVTQKVSTSVGDKLTFPVYGIHSTPFDLAIHKGKKSLFTWQSVVYSSKLMPQTTSTYDYTRDGNLVKRITVQVDSCNTQEENVFDETGKFIVERWAWFPNHSIKQHQTLALNPCNSTEHEVKYQHPRAIASTFDNYNNGTYKWSEYDELGRNAATIVYTVGSTEVIYTNFINAKGKLVDGKKTVIKLAHPYDPCTFKAIP